MYSNRITANKPVTRKIWAGCNMVTCRISKSAQRTRASQKRARLHTCSILPKGLLKGRLKFKGKESSCHHAIERYNRLRDMLLEDYAV